ncbi:MAG: hypothetical protein FWG56_09895 [Desulfovibrionaceae bacterium]|jgi:hypothetical protein|nr:hypothetical protein [Desulfovibrionaceae bacterium]
MKTLLKTIPAFALGLCLAAGASAQGAKDKKIVFPAGLDWQTMDLVAFNFNYPGYEGKPGSREVAHSIWGEIIDKFPTRSDGKKWSAFVILSAFENISKRFYFSSLDAASTVYPLCEDPPNHNSKDTPIYSQCPMRVVIQDKASGQSTHQDFPRYCIMTTNDKDQPKTRNYAQVAVHPATNTAYFRVVQYGKPAPECDRAIKLPR